MKQQWWVWGWIGLATWISVLSCQTGGERRQPVVVDDESVLAALPSTVPAPPDNPTTPAKAALGRLLFFDPILSGHKDVACATCHHPDFGYAEFQEVSIGVNGEGFGSRRHFREPNNIPLVKRNSQTVLNAAFNGIGRESFMPGKAPMFWDLRAAGLEAQALEPIKAFEEMRGHAYEKEVAPDSVVRRLNAIPQYRRLFTEAFGTREPIRVDQLAKALAAYQRTLVATNSRFDQYLRGDRQALSENEREGLKLFLKSGCAKCHNGPMLSDYQLHTLGVADNDRLPGTDAGAENRYAFRTPSLRNLRYTAPYMHSGKLPTLQSVLEFYEDLAGRTVANPHVKPEQLDPLIRDLRVNFRDISLIIDFLNTLNDDHFDRTVPERVPSGLRVGGNIN